MSREDPTDLAEEAARDEAKATIQRNLAETEKADLDWLMSSPRGRRVAWRILDGAGLYRSSFTGNSETFFKEGARSEALKLKAKLLGAAPNGYFTMLQEHDKP